MVTKNKRSKEQCAIKHIVIDSDIVTPSDKEWNLEAIFDSTMDPEAFINIKCKSAFYNLRNISWVRKSLTTVAVKTIIQTFVTCNLDYCNSLLCGTTSSLLYCLQKAQNYAARILNLNRIIYHPPWLSCIGCLKTTHWLQNSSVHLQSIEWPGPCISGWPPYTIQAEKEPLVHW